MLKIGTKQLKTKETKEIYQKQENKPNSHQSRNNSYDNGCYIINRFCSENLNQQSPCPQSLLKLPPPVTMF